MFPKAPAVLSKNLVLVFGASGAPSGFVVIFESLGCSFDFKAILSRSLGFVLILNPIGFDIFVFDALTIVNNPKCLKIVVCARTFVLVILFKPLRKICYAKPFILVIMFVVLNNIH